MRLAMIFGAAALAGACGSGDRQPAPGEQLAAAAPVTIELPPELPPPAEPPKAEEKPAAPVPEEAPEEVEEKAALPKTAAETEAPPPKKADAGAEAGAPAEEPRQPAEEPAAPAEEVGPVGERPPLPDATIARTIDRIGYRCGAVRSAARVEQSGGSPVYRISCASGETYRGTNRGGRMYFRPWEGRRGGR